MLKNADCTFYEKETYAKHTVEGVYWNDSRGMTAGKNGVQISDSVIIYIYNNDYIPKNGDIVVKGDMPFNFDTTTQKSISECVKQFRQLYPEFAVVKNVNDVRYGGLPHIEVIAR